ncbi:MAG: phosphoribosyltransferase family protein [Microbacteriaceae bacterium]
MQNATPNHDGMRLISEAVRDALAVIAPTRCAGCQTEGRAVCQACLTQLRAKPRLIQIGTASPFPVWAALEYRGVVRRLLLAFKDGGRTDAASALADPLRLAIAAALANATGDTVARGDPVPSRAGPGIELATIPSSRAAIRARGYRPVELLLARAGLRAAHPLAATRQAEDQAGLGLVDRQRNRAESLVVHRRLVGRSFLLIDDIVTTGATLLEARRAIEESGAVVHAAATIAFTRRLSHRNQPRANTDRLLGDLSNPPHYGWSKGVDESPWIWAARTSDQGGCRGN